MKRTRLLAFALALVACAKTRAPIAPSSFSVTRPAAPWPEKLPHCQIDSGWDQMCAPAFDIRDAKGLALAHVERTTYTHVRWISWPLLGSAPNAYLEATAGGLRVTGFASIADQSFFVRHPIELAGPNVRIPSGALVSILGTSGSRLVIEARTGFANPAKVEAAIECSSFGGSTPEAMPSGPPYARPRAKSTSLRASADGPIVLSFEPREGDAWVWLDRQGDFVHVVGGHHAWRKLADRTSFVFDGWVPSDDVTKVDAIDSDWDSGCDPVDLHDTCPNGWTSRDAIVRASPNGAAIGSLAKGSNVVPLEKREGFTAFHTPNDEIVAPKGTQFWLADADLENGCVGTPMEDGCPCVP